MMPPKYDLEKIKFATDRPTFEKAVDLYERGKVMQFEEQVGSYSAVVRGTKPYRVSVEARRYDSGHCECYLGQRHTLCKHMVAVAIRAITGGEPLNDEEKTLTHQAVCSGRLGALNKGELTATKKALTAAMRHIKPYHGPSRLWFSYQHSLEEGCHRFAKIVSEFPVSEQTAGLLVDLLLRLDRKLCQGGVDDSNGTVGGFIEETVQVLKEYAQHDSACAETFQKLKNRDTCFGWEEPLLKLIND
ncbi:MAG: hypothetical protein MRJ96_08435 [Nitrospirales bacterium]|nr:hypothetical protein [Nitrospira sp.]MDR4501460.1 hypothetical protein [Nitrospirales bacterium]